MSDRRGSSAVRAIIGVALIGYLAFSGAIDWSLLLGLAASWWLSVLALGLLFLVVVLVSWRLCILLVAQGLTLPFGASLRLTLIGAFFNAFLPGSAGGDVARAYLAAKPNAGHGIEITTIVLMDRLIGLLALLLLPLFIGVSLGSAHEWPASVDTLLRFAGLATLVLCVAALTARSHGALRRGVAGALRTIRLERHAERFLDTVYAYRHRPATLFKALAISLLIQALLLGALVVLAVAVGAGPVDWTLVLVIPFGMLANALPITPGGIGVGEAAMEALFRSVGATGGAETLLAWRVLTTLIDLAGGAILLAGHTNMSMMKRMTEAVQEEQATQAGPGARAGQ